jgi:hypothetical protein
VSLISLVGFVSNIWSLFVFQLTESTSQTNYCDVKDSFHDYYYIVNITYVCIVILIPLAIVIISNVLIVVKSKKDDLNRKNLEIELTEIQKKRQSSIITKNNLKSCRKKVHSKKIAKTLTLISVTYVFLNLPYLIMWFIYYSEMNSENQHLKNYLFALLQIAEICMVS